MARTRLSAFGCEKSKSAASFRSQSNELTSTKYCFVCGLRVRRLPSVEQATRRRLPKDVPLSNCGRSQRSAGGSKVDGECKRDVPVGSSPSQRLLDRLDEPS